MESRFGYDFSHVRIYTDSRAGQSARAINALAYTVGHKLVFADGSYSPGSLQGRHLLAHELAHIKNRDILIKSPCGKVSHGAFQYTSSPN